MDRKCQSMDYEYLEDKNVHDMVFRVDRGEGGGFGMLGNMLSYWEFLIRSAVSIVAAVVVIFPLFVDVTRVRDGFMTSWLASLLLFAIIGFITVLNYILDVKYGEAVWEYRERHRSIKTGCLIIWEFSLPTKDRKICAFSDRGR